MAEWAAIYASLPSKNTPPVEEFPKTRHDSVNLRLPHPNRPEISSICVEIDSDASTSDDEDGFGTSQSDMYGGTYIQRRVDERPNYANNTYLRPPQPNRHRSQTQQQSLSQGTYIQQQRQEHASYTPNHYRQVHTERYTSRHRSPSLPPIYRTPYPSPAELPARSASSSKPRKHRPTPLDLGPRFKGTYVDDTSAAPSPYSPGILALYSPGATIEPTLSPQSRTRSLPIYTFRACDLPSPSTGIISIPSPLLENDRSPHSSITSFSSIFSPGISPGSVDSGRTSLSPNEMATPYRGRYYI